MSAVVTTPAEVDIANAGAVRAELKAVLRQGAVSLRVDMSQTTFCDCSGVSALIGAYLLAKECAAEFALLAGTPAVRRVFELTGVGAFFDIQPAPSSVLAAAARGGQPPAKGGGWGGSPLTSVTSSRASSRSLMLRLWEAVRRTPNASDWVQRRWPMITPSAWSMTARLTSDERNWSTSAV